MPAFKTYATYYWRAALMLFAMFGILAALLYFGLRLVVPQDEVLEVQGRVLDTDGEGLHGVEVRWMGEGPFSVTHSEPDGTFSLPVLGGKGIENLAGALAFYHPTHLPQQVTYTGPELQSGTLEVRLDPKPQALPPNPALQQELSGVLQGLRASKEELQEGYWEKEAQASNATERERARNAYAHDMAQLSEQIKYLQADSLMYVQGIISWTEVEASMEDARTRWAPLTDSQ